MKQLIYFITMSLILCLTTSQKSKPEIGQGVSYFHGKPINDSTAYISLKDITTFNELLKKSISYEQYTKLSPEATLTELWNWKMQQLNPPKKQLADTTKPKK